MKSKNKTLRLRALLAALALAAPMSALAHKQFLLPSYTVLSEKEWVTVDAAVSNELFLFNHNPARLDALKITSPTGKTVAAQNQLTARYRSTFDVELTEPGTWRIALENQGLFANWEEGGQSKRWRGTVEAFEKEVPKNAEKLVVNQMANRVETYVTAGAPTTAVFEPTGQGLELVPVTHPNDLFAGEAASFKLVLDGQPAANLKVTVVPGGVRYRNTQDAIEVNTDAHGQFSVEWPAPGMYWLNASVQDDKAAKPATGRRASWTATMEVLPE